MANVKCLYCGNDVEENSRCKICGQVAKNHDDVRALENIVSETGKISTLLGRCPRCHVEQSDLDAQNGLCAACDFNINEYLGNGMFGKTKEDNVIKDHIPGAKIGYVDPKDELASLAAGSEEVESVIASFGGEE